MKKAGLFFVFAMSIFLIAVMSGFTIDFGTQAMNDVLHPACKAFSGHCDERLFINAVVSCSAILVGISLLVVSLAGLVSEVIYRPRKAIGHTIAYVACGIGATIALVLASLMAQFGWYMFQSDLVGMWCVGIAISAVFMYLTYGDDWLQDATA